METAVGSALQTTAPRIVQVIALDAIYYTFRTVNHPIQIMDSSSFEIPKPKINPSATIRSSPYLCLLEP